MPFDAGSVKVTLNCCRDLEVAYRVLARLVKVEYPEGRKLSEIARIWGEGVTDDELAVLRRLDSHQEES